MPDFDSPLTARSGTLHERLCLRVGAGDLTGRWSLRYGISQDKRLMAHELTHVIQQNVGLRQFLRIIKNLRWLL